MLLSCALHYGNKGISKIDEDSAFYWMYDSSCFYSKLIHRYFFYFLQLEIQNLAKCNRVDSTIFTIGVLMFVDNNKFDDLFSSMPSFAQLMWRCLRLFRLEPSTSLLLELSRPFERTLYFYRGIWDVCPQYHEQLHHLDNSFWLNESNETESKFLQLNWKFISWL